MTMKLFIKFAEYCKNTKDINTMLRLAELYPKQCKMFYDISNIQDMKRTLNTVKELKQ